MVVSYGEKICKANGFQFVGSNLLPGGQFGSRAMLEG